MKPQNNGKIKINKATGNGIMKKKRKKYTI